MTRHETRHGTAEARETIAARLKEAQGELGMKTEELARETGISLRLVQKHRAADNAPSWDTLTRYSRVLKKPVAWFLEAA